MMAKQFTLEDCKITYECITMHERLRGKLDFITKFIEEQKSHRRCIIDKYKKYLKEI